MGTRARINIYEEEQILVSIYRQMDGYPAGLGADIKDFVLSPDGKEITLVNGYSGSDTRRVSNGMGCFAAQLIKHLKEDVGSIYIRDTSSDSLGEEYSYNLYEKEGRVHVRILEGSVTFFGAPGDSEDAMDLLYDGLVADFDPETDY